tara:strand:- start:102 stop:458 length:357 start_codon:yes stop_codon:yes gene_type:complete
MRKPIYANQEHKVLIEAYITMVKEFIRDVSSQSRYKNFQEVLDVIIQYHNNYGKSVRENNYWDWLMILPINLSVMASGYLAAIETKGNATLVRSYRVLVSELVQDVVDKIEKIEPIHE